MHACWDYYNQVGRLAGFSRSLALSLRAIFGALDFRNFSRNKIMHLLSSSFVLESSEPAREGLKNQILCIRARNTIRQGGKNFPLVYKFKKVEKEVGKVFTIKSGFRAFLTQDHPIQKR